MVYSGCVVFYSSVVDGLGGGFPLLVLTDAAAMSSGTLVCLFIGFGLGATAGAQFNLVPVTWSGPDCWHSGLPSALPVSLSGCVLSWVVLVFVFPRSQMQITYLGVGQPLDTLLPEMLLVSLSFLVVLKIEPRAISLDLL